MGRTRTRDEERLYRAEYRKLRYLQREPMRVDATGTHRRLQALVAVGWSGPELSRRVGRSRGWVGDTLSQRQVSRAKRDLVARLYEQLWNKPPPASTSMQRHDVTYARTTARRNGWLPPMAWDEDTIDDPTAKPAVPDGDVVDVVAVKRALDGKPVQLSPAETDAVVAMLVQRGDSNTMIWKKIGVGSSRSERIRKHVTREENAA